jgi:hypothetical protein
MPDQRPATSSEPTIAEDADEAGGTGPYLAIVLVALAIGVGLAVYVAGYREEILAILTQSPT